MQETLLVSETDEVTYTFCDKCNSEGDPQATWNLPDDWAKALDLPLGSVVLRGTFRGTSDEAVAKGWVERDWGFMCPVCQRLEVEGEGEPGEPMTSGNALVLLVGEEEAAKLAAEAAEKIAEEAARQEFKTVSDANQRAILSAFQIDPEEKK